MKMVNFKLLLFAVVVAADGQSPIHDNHKASVTAAAGVLGWYPWQGQCKFPFYFSNYYLHDT